MCNCSIKLSIHIIISVWQNIPLLKWKYVFWGHLCQMNLPMCCKSPQVERSVSCGYKILAASDGQFTHPFPSWHHPSRTKQSLLKMILSSSAFVHRYQEQKWFDIWTQNYLFTETLQGRGIFNWDMVYDLTIENYVFFVFFFPSVLTSGSVNYSWIVVMNSL